MASKPVTSMEAAAAEREPLAGRRLAILLAAIVALEALLFCWSFGKFFCGDSLYYLWYRLESPADALRLLANPDHLNSYRPLNYIAFSWLLFPLFGLNPLGYHFVALAAHLATTGLLFLLLKQIVDSRAAIAAGLLLFGLHATNFYITYDMSFLPDFGSGFFYTGALAAYAAFARTRRAAWLWTSVGAFAVALLFKESALTLIVGVAVVDLLLQRRRAAAALSPDADDPGSPWIPGAGILPFIACGALFVAWMIYIKGGSVYPSGSGEPYALTLDSEILKLKLRYLAWIANLPAQLLRRSWLTYAAIVPMVPALVWAAVQTVRVARRRWFELLLCAGWALAALAPVLLIVQQPMKHNLYLPVLACAVAIALVVDTRAKHADRLTPGVVLLGMAMLFGTALQIPDELRLSWVGEGSTVAENSLRAVQRAYPQLPRGSILYVLPTTLKGKANWYFQGSGMFSMYYKDPSLQMRFADLGHPVPPDFATRNDVFFFHFHDQTLWDVTRPHKRDASDTASLRLLDRVARAQIENDYAWQTQYLPDNRDVAAVLPLARNGASRRAWIMVAGTRARIPVPAIPAGSVLQVGAAISGPLHSGVRGRITFEDAETRETRLLYSASLDASADAGNWWDSEVDLAELAGRRGTLLLESFSDQQADWFAWSRLRIIQRANPWYLETTKEIDQPLLPREYRLIDRFEDAQINFDRGEKYPNYERFDTPTGKPVFLYASPEVRPGHFALVTIAGATARFSLKVPAGAKLDVAALNIGDLGDGVRGRVYVEEQGAERERIYDELLPARGKHWVGQPVSLEKWAGHTVTITLEASSGPNHETVADWCAWARLRVVSR